MKGSIVQEFLSYLKLQMWEKKIGLLDYIQM